MSVARAQSEIDAREFAEWNVVESIEPTDRDDWQRAAMIACVIANANRGKNQKAFTVEDFMPRRKKKKQTPAQMFAVFSEFAAAHNAALAAKEKRGRR